MSKTLHLLRHAKSAWDDPGIGDRERGLNKRGRRNAPQMGAVLADRLEPQVIHVSPARRAQLTLGGLQDGWEAIQGLDHSTEEDLYTFSATDLVDFIRRQADEREVLFLIGHNPGLTDLVNWLCGETVIANLPTAAYVQLRLAIDRWRDLDAGTATLVDRIFPRELEPQS